MDVTSTKAPSSGSNLVAVAMGVAIAVQSWRLNFFNKFFVYFD